MVLIIVKAVEIFEYGKNNNRYYNRIKLYKQVVEKALSIIKVFYLRYSLCFLFDNITSHFIYAKDILQIKDMNKRVGGKSLMLYNKQFDQENIRIINFMTFLDNKSEVIQKSV